MDLLVIDPIDAEVMRWLASRHRLRFAPELAFAPREFRRALYNVQGSDRAVVGRASTPRRSISRRCCGRRPASAPAPRTSTSRPASGATSRSCAA